MTGPISRDLDDEEITHVSRGDPKWERVFTSLRYIERNISDMRSDQKLAAEWRASHAIEDALNFQQIRNDISNIREKGAVVISSVDNYNTDKAKLKGMWMLIGWIGAGMGGVMGVIAFVHEVLK